MMTFNKMWGKASLGVRGTIPWAHIAQNSKLSDLSNIRYSWRYMVRDLLYGVYSLIKPKYSSQASLPAHVTEPRAHMVIY